MELTADAALPLILSDSAGFDRVARALVAANAAGSWLQKAVSGLCPDDDSQPSGRMGVIIASDPVQDKWCKASCKRRACTTVLLGTESARPFGAESALFAFALLGQFTVHGSAVQRSLRGNAYL